ncbi:MAG: TIGR03792 family protein [Rhodobacterales bacterium]|nr:TIGR03792 family protein [Rhodobacterales bacterium]
MVIEWLSYRVPVALQARFLALDDTIWTAALSRHPGYIGKETWRDAADPEALHLIIRWDSRAAWKAVPAALLAQVQADFDAALGQSLPAPTCTEMAVLPASA